MLIPDNLVSSARNEAGTPYWFTARKHGITSEPHFTEGGTVDVGVIELKIHSERRPGGDRRRRPGGLAAPRPYHVPAAARCAGSRPR